MGSLSVRSFGFICHIKIFQLSIKVIVLLQLNIWTLIIWMIIFIIELLLKMSQFLMKHALFYLILLFLYFKHIFFLEIEIWITHFFFFLVENWTELINAESAKCWFIICFALRKSLIKHIPVPQTVLTKKICWAVYIHFSL